MVEKGYLEKETREKLLFTNSFEEIEEFIKNYKAPDIREYHNK